MNVSAAKAVLGAGATSCQGSEERARAGGGQSLASESRICGCAQGRLPRGRRRERMGTWRLRAENRKSCGLTPRAGDGSK